jgi:hypothetical protein
MYVLQTRLASIATRIYREENLAPLKVLRRKRWEAA